MRLAKPFAFKALRATPINKISNATNKISNAAHKIICAAHKILGAAHKISVATNEISNVIHKISKVSHKICDARNEISNTIHKISNAAHKIFDTAREPFKRDDDKSCSNPMYRWQNSIPRSRKVGRPLKCCNRCGGQVDPSEVGNLRRNETKIAVVNFRYG